MAQTITKRTPVAERAPAQQQGDATAPDVGAVDRATRLSEDVLKSVEAGQRAAIEAVRKFVDSVDATLAGHHETPSRRQEIVDSAMEMADRLVHTQYDFIRRVIDTTAKTLREHNGAE
jgi:hypothetical protein